MSNFQSMENEWQQRCEEIHIDYCKDMKYNQTILPNLLNHYKQKDAAEELSQYKHLMTSHCNQFLNVFLCSLFVPVCTIYFKPIPPCRALCYHVQADCEPLMKTFKYSWPNIFECSQFPESGMCVGENLTKISKHKNDWRLTETPNRPYNKKQNELNKQNIYKEILYSIFYDPSGNPELQCPLHSQVSPSMKYHLKINHKTIRNCGLPCHFFYNSWKIRLSSQLMGWLSIVCLVVTIFNLLSFLLDSDQFNEAEKCIVAMVGCYGAVGLGYFTGFVFGDQVSCVQVSEGGMVETQGTNNEYCTLVFLLLYYFGMAANVWWVLLCVSLILQSGMIPTFKTIKPQYLHFIAWALPALTTIIVLAIGNVEGDGLVGVCYVGFSMPKAFKILVITPLMVYLLLGLVFMLVAFVSLYLVKERMRKDELCTVEVEKLMIRMVIFSIFFCLPAATIIVCHFLELSQRMNWLMGWYLKQYHHLPNPQQLDLLVNQIINPPNYLHPSLHSPQNDLQSFLLHPPLSLQPLIHISIYKHLILLLSTLFISAWLAFFKTFSIFRDKLLCRREDVEKTGHKNLSSTNTPSSLKTGSATTPV